MNIENNGDKSTVIALYLPQFHPFKENDEWWGKGYTEWISVARAKKLFPGHEQPKLPGELGFYDLRLPQTREAQADMAREYGIDGFCYYYYRLNKNMTLMDLPLKEVHSSGKPDFPFMICWANHDWEAKAWNSYDKYQSKMLAKQEYGDDKDIEDYFYELLPYFKDERYMKEGNRPLFMVYRPLDVANPRNFISIWNRLAKENGFAGIYFMGFTHESQLQKDDIFANGFETMVSCRMHALRHNHSQVKRYIGAAVRRIFRLPYVAQYKDVIKDLVSDEAKQENIVPVIMPNWDHSPRTGRYTLLWTNCTPQLFKKHVQMVYDKIKDKKNKIVFVKSWNEWGEGNYLEPDRKWQRAFLEAFLSVRKENEL